MDAYRLRQIPEMSLPTGFIALATLALADSTGNSSLTIHVAGGAGLLFVIWDVLVLLQRSRSMQLVIPTTDLLVASALNLASIGAGIAALAAPTAGALEWLLTMLIARPGAAFLLALADVTDG